MTLRRWESWAVVDSGDGCSERMLGRHFTRWSANFWLDMTLGSPNATLTVVMARIEGWPLTLRGEIRRSYTTPEGDSLEATR